MQSTLEILMAVLVLIGSFFAFVGSLGLVRLRGLFPRLHAPTKASTLGLGGVLLAALLAPAARGGFPGLYELLLTLFIFVTAPVSAQMIAHAALRSMRVTDRDDRIPSLERPEPGDDENE